MSNTFTHIYVEENGVMVRYPYSDFINNISSSINLPSLVEYVPEPDSPLTEGLQGQFSASDWDLENGGESISSSAFVYSNNAWRKIPTYTTNWDDIEPIVDENGTIVYLRFLPVHKVIELSDIEKQNVKTSIDIADASQDKAGLVKGSSPSDIYGSVTIQEGGSATADLATTVFAGTVILDNTGAIDPISNKVYTKEAIDARLSANGTLNYPIASYEDRGGVIITPETLSVDSDGRIAVYKAAVQEANSAYGVVRYAPESFEGNGSSSIEENSHVLSIAQIRKLIQYYTNQLSANAGLLIASKDVLGGIKVDPESTSLYYITEGLLNVKQASTTNYGTVKLLSTSLYDQISSSETAIPTAYNIVQYVNSKLTGDGGTLLPSKLPKATTTSLGAIKVGASLTITDGVLNVPAAVSNTSNTIAGIVTLTQDIANNINNKSLVPTTYAVDYYITNKLKELNSNNQLVPSASSSRAGTVYVYPASNETATSGTYKVPTLGYLNNVITNLTNYIPNASDSKPGIVSVQYGADEIKNSSTAPQVPTVNYVNTQIAEAINNALGGDDGTGDSSASTAKYTAWMVMGTASFTQAQVDLALQQFNTVLGYGGLTIPAFISNKISTAIAAGMNIFVFNKALSSGEIISFLYYFFDTTDNEEELEGSGSGGADGVLNNFVILPAAGTFGNYVGVGVNS